MFSNNNPKLKILGCYRSTPLNINLVPRFGETWEEDKVDHQSFFWLSRCDQRIKERHRVKSMIKIDELER